MTYHKIQTQREPDIEVLVSETSFAMGFILRDGSVERFNIGPREASWELFGHYLGTVELVSPSEGARFRRDRVTVSPSEGGKAEK